MAIFRKYGRSERPRFWEWLQYWIVEDRRVYVVEMDRKELGWSFAEVNLFGVEHWPMSEAAIMADLSGPSYDQTIPREPVTDPDFIRRLLDFARRADTAPDGHYIKGKELQTHAATI